MQAEAEENQKKGKSGMMVDPKPETGEGGQVTVKVTPGLIREIFEEYPEVLRAYSDNVPVPLDSQQFWTRYFQSKLFNRNRSTNRAAVNTVKDDNIFDRYLGEEDDDIEPKHMQPHNVDLLLDLQATEEDQHEITNRPDMTMRAGGQRASLPLMRRFNEHSERLLNQALGKEPPRNNMGLNPGNAGARNEEYSAIILDDLTNPIEQSRILLSMSNKIGVTATSSSGRSGHTHSSGIDALPFSEKRELVEGVVNEVEYWEGRLEGFEIDEIAVRDAVADMRGFVEKKVERASRDSSSSTLSDTLLRELVTLQASSNELLRQFWSASLPPKTGAPQTSEEERRKKVERMRAYLGKTEERARGVLEGLKGEEVRKRAEAALQPVREAVAFALKYNL